MRSGVGLGPVPGLCLLAKRRERRFPEAGQSIAKPRSAGYPKITATYNERQFHKSVGTAFRRRPQLVMEHDVGMTCKADRDPPFLRDAGSITYYEKNNIVNAGTF